MADQKKWFKVWNAILTDPSFESLPNEILGIWTRLGCILSLQGDRGKVTAPRSYFERHLRCKFDAMMLVPNIIVEEVKNDNDDITVTLKNWFKYQIDSTVYDRVKKYRKPQICNGVRGEENKKRKEENKRPPIVPQTDFDSFWGSYPKKVGKQAALRSWEIARKKSILPPIETILQAINTQKEDEQWCRDGGQYIPHPATWLNQGRWDDKPIPWTEKVRMTK